MKTETKLDPRICATFSTVTPESAEHGDFADTGWIDEGGTSMEPDELDIQDGLTVVDIAVNFLQRNGATQASASHFHPGVWYSADCGTDYRTCETEERSYHLKDFTPEQEQAVWDKMHTK